MLLEFLEALFQNPKLDLEYFLHLVLLFLIRCLLSFDISVNQSDREPIFRTKAALLLARVLAQFEAKYPALKFDVFKLVNEFLLRMLDPQRPPHQLSSSEIDITNAIFIFYSQVNSAFLDQLFNTFVSIIHISQKMKTKWLIRLEGFIVRL